MPTADDLVGSGVPPLVAGVLGNQPSSCACLGTSQGTAASILSTNVELVPSSSQTGAILSGAAKVGTPYYFFNGQSTSGVIYPPVGDAINGSTNGSFTLAQNKAAILIKYKTSAANPTVGSWSSILTA